MPVNVDINKTPNSEALLRKELFFALHDKVYLTNIIRKIEVMACWQTELII